MLTSDKKAKRATCQSTESGTDAASPLRPALLLLSADGTLAEMVAGSIQPPWTLAHYQSSGRNHEAFNLPNVRLVLLDDDTVDSNDRGMMLRHIRKYFPSVPLLYVAGDHDGENERRARSNGAHYYAAKPLALDRFGHVLESFLRANK